MQKYKVFFNEKRIVFSVGSKITLSKSIADFTGNGTNKGICKWWLSFLAGEESETVLEHANPKLLFEQFKAAFIVVKAAGGVIIHKNKILFIYRNGIWDLPKGKIDEGETPKQAAVREVEEECGIRGHEIVKPLPSTYHIFQSPYKNTKGKWIFKETFWYEMQYNGEKHGVPQIEEGITEVRWFKKNELDEVLANTYENLKEIINLYRD